METEVLKIINEGINPGLLMLIKSIVLITVVLAIVIVPLYLAGVTWLCYEEIRQPLRRRMRITPELPSPDIIGLSSALAALEDCPVENVAAEYTVSGKTLAPQSWKPSLRRLPGLSR